MVVQVVPPSATYEVSGNGYVPEGEFRKSADSPATQPSELYGLLLQLAPFATMLCWSENLNIWTMWATHRRCPAFLAGKARLDKSQIEHLPVWASFPLI